MADGDGSGAGKTVLIILAVLGGLAIVCCGGGFLLMRDVVDDIQAEFIGVQGSGVLVTEEREVGAFERVEIHSRGADVDVIVGETTSVTVELDDNVIALLTTEVVGDALVIDSTETFTPSDGARITIVTPALSAVVMDGHGDTSITGVNTTSFTVEVAGAGDVSAAGTADDVTVTLGGAGNVDLEDLAARRAQVTISGAGNVTVRAAESVDATISGAGTVKYAGDPESVTDDISGAGSVVPLGR